MTFPQKLPGVVPFRFRNNLFEQFNSAQSKISGSFEFSKVRNNIITSENKSEISFAA